MEETIRNIADGVFIMVRPAGQAHSINKALTDSQVKRLLDVASASTRDTAIVWLCLSGCRIGEAVSIRFRDIMAGGEVLGSFVLNRNATKGKATREVLLGSKARNAVKAHIATFNGDFEPDDRVIPLNPSYAATLIKSLMAKSGLDYRYSSHSLRKTFCTKAVLGKVNIAYIQRCMGHSNISTTNSYVEVHCTGNEKEILNLW